MINLLFNHKILSIAVIALSLTACSDESKISNQTKIGTAEESGNESLVAGQQETQELAQPDPKTMDVEVAKVVQEAWDNLHKALAQVDINETEKAEAYASYGLSTFGNGLTIPAEKAFQKAVRLAPQEVKWRYFLALMHQYNGDLDSAISGFEEVLKIRPNDAPSMLRKADAHFEQSQMEQAKSLYESVLLAGVEQAAALYGLGRIENSMGNHNQAVEHLEKAIKLQPDANQINYFLGMSYRSLGDKEKAKRYLALRGTNEPSFGDPLFDKISGGESRIDGLWAHMNAGSQAFVDKNYALAVKEFQLATEDLPEDSRSWQSLGMALNRKGDSRQAINAYETALNLDDQNAVIHHELAKLQFSAGDRRRAEQHFKAALSLDPKMIDAYRSYASLLSNSNRNSDALIQLQTALKLDPQDSDLIITHAQTLVALKQTKMAAESLSNALADNPRNTELRNAYGLVLADNGNLSAALRETQTALANAQDSVSRSRAQYSIGQVHLRQGKPQEAIQSFGLALEANPENRPAALELARSFIRVQDYAQALGTYEVYLNKWPSEDGARVEAARVSVMLGNGAKGVAILTAGAAKQTASPRLLGSLARLLVLSTEPSIKNPELALEYARRALTHNKGSQHRETLALVHSAQGRFADAIRIQTQLIADTKSQTTPRVSTRMQKNLERYKSNTLGRLPFDAS